MILCAAVVGQANNPLYLESFVGGGVGGGGGGGGGGGDALKFHHAVHCALDVIEERVLAAKRSGANGGAAAGGGSDTFLGLLYPTEDYRVYGYVSNTRIKFVLVADDEELRDADVRSFFRRFHLAYVDAASNPFHVPGKRITSPAFAERVGTIVRSFRATAMT
eukprot:SM000009S23549  [mRNA]  locus=s9:631103:632355:- [translate_table: standard]